MSQLPPVGDRGQRYEVVQVKHDGSVQVWGWTNQQDGGVLAKSVMLHPNTAICRVFDRGTPNVVLKGNTQ